MHQRLRSVHRALTDDEIDLFSQLVKEAWDKPWWRRLVDTIVDRQHSLLITLAMGTLDQRAEDRLRGQIDEDSFFLALDIQGELMNEKEKRDGTGR